MAGTAHPSRIAAAFTSRNRLDAFRARRRTLAGTTIDPGIQSRTTHEPMPSAASNDRIKPAIEIEIAICRTTTGRLHAAPERLNARTTPTAGASEAIAHHQ